MAKGGRTFRGGRGRGCDFGGRSESGGGRGKLGGHGGGLSHIECHYCHEMGHFKRNCSKLQGRSQSFQSAHIAATAELESSTTRMIAMTDEEFARYSQFQASQSSTASIVQTGNSVACLSDSKSKWVIDSGATDHMTGNAGILSSFQSPTRSFSVKLANRSATPVVENGSTTVYPHITLSNVLCLSQFPLNLLSISRIARTYNCSVFFFPDHCVF